MLQFPHLPGVPRMRCFLTLAILSSFVQFAAADEAKPPPRGAVADLILINGKIWTVNKDQPEAEALAVWRDRILAVGSSAEIRKLAGPRTRVIDLKGRRVLPGFYDSHVHLLG